MSLLVVGSVAFDSVVTPFGEAKDVLGGSATFFSISASYFTKVNLIACVGKDFSNKHLGILKGKNIDVSGLQSLEGETFRWSGKYSENLSEAQTLCTKLNVFSEFNPILSKEQKLSKYIFLANIDPCIQESILNQIVDPKVVACDSMNLWITNHRKALLKVLKKVDIFFLNENESKMLSDGASVLNAAEMIMGFGPKIVVIKKGEHGAVVFSKDWYFSVPAYLLKRPKDPTGAGDCFAGGFMGYLAKSNRLTKNDLKKAAVYGTVMASYNVEEFSVKRIKSLTDKEIQNRFNQIKEISCF